MRAIILTNAHTHYEELDYQPRRLKEELNKLDVSVDVVDNNFFPAYIKDNKIINNVKEYDFCIYLDKDIITLSALEQVIKCFNSCQSIRICDDKALTNIFLSAHNIPVINTYFAPKIYNQQVQLSELYLNNIESNLNYPFIMKLNKSSQGWGVYLIENREQLIEKLNTYKTNNVIFQEYISDNTGEDIRVIVINKEPIGAIKRINKGDYRSNLTSGGKSEIFELDQKLMDLSKKIATILNIDYVGLDFLVKDGEYILCEANSNAFFKGFEDTTCINVAAIYAKYIKSIFTN